jgi:hypothetical protein
LSLGSRAFGRFFHDNRVGKDRGQRTEDRGQRTEDGRRKAETRPRTQDGRQGNSVEGIESFDGLRVDFEG